MNPSSALQLTRCMGYLSVAALILGLGLALYALQMNSSSPVDLSGALALVVLWLTNLVTLILNAIYWWIRRWPKWLLATVVVQACAAIAALIPMLTS